MMLRRVFLVIVLMLLAVVGLPGGLPKTALACSAGVYPPFTSVYKNSEVVVKAKVVEVDDLGQNAVVQVERYYKGNAGKQYLLFFRQHPLTMIGVARGMRGGGDCATLYEAVQRGDTVYLMGTRLYSGAYFSSGLFKPEYFVYRNPGDTASVYIGEGNIADVEHTEAALQALIAAQNSTNSDTAVPITDFSHPSYAPLLVTTKNGTQYVVPVDGGSPFAVGSIIGEQKIISLGSGEDLITSFGRGKERCIGLYCEAFSRFGYSYNDEGYKFAYCRSKYEYKAALFSPVGTFAIWADSGIYLGCGDSLIAALNTDNKGATEALAAHAQWSADGRRFVYSDLKGLWLWEAGAVTGNPRLLVPATDAIPQAQYFSPLGTHLSVSEGEKRYTLNIKTGKTFFDGVFSPTEQIFVAFGTVRRETGLFNAQVCWNDKSFGNLNTFCDMENGKPDTTKEVVTAIMVNPDRFAYIDDMENIQHIEWTGTYELLALTLPRPEYPDPTPPDEYWNAADGYLLRDYVVGIDTRSLQYPNLKKMRERSQLAKVPLRFTSGFDFIFDRANRGLAVLKNDSTLIVNGQTFGYTIGKEIDSPIVQIDWLPSLMYRDRAR
jgi:hypothetical protein